MLLTCIKNCHNVLMLQATRSFRFTEETLARIDQFVAGKLLAERHGLDGHHATDLWVFPQVHHPHGALAKLFVDLVAAQHWFFHCAAVQQHGPAWMCSTATQYDRLRQILGPVQFRLQILVVLVVGRHVLIHGLGLVELALAFEIQRQVVHIAHHRVAHGNPAETVKSHVELTLALQSQAHHAVGLRRFFVRFELARLGYQEALGRQRQVANS